MIFPVESLPPWAGDVFRWLGEAFALLLIVYGFLTAAIPVLARMAKLTRWGWDDRAVDGMGWALGKLAMFLDLIQRWLPVNLRANPTALPDDRKTRPRGPGLSGVIVGVVALSLAAGCGSGRWDAHAYTALALRDTANAARDALSTHHELELRQAVGRAAPGGESAALEAADARWRARWAEVRSAHELAAHAVNTYSAATLAALRGDAAEEEAVRAYAAHAVRALNAAVRLAGERGLSLPSIPEEIVEWVSSFVEWVK